MAKEKKTRSQKAYGSYMFMTKDPVIDEMRTMMQDFAPDGVITSRVLRQIEVSGGPTASCMRAWVFGSTKRPTNPSVEAAGRAMGWKRKWVSMSAKEKDTVRKRLSKNKK